ncbi:MAG: proline racemase family protein [Hyphomicrobiales bacterium]
MYFDLSNWKYIPPNDWLNIKTIDLHTGGEPLRVIVNGLPQLKGNNILEFRRYFKENLDYIRTGLMFEPRGHADMYGAIITRPVSKNADFGTFFLHNEGYSTMCGHAIIALTKLVLDTGMIYKEEKHPELIIDAPPGLIKAKAYRENELVTSVSFQNVPSFVLSMNNEIEIPSLGKIKYDIAYGGAFYAFVDADQYNIALNPGNYNQLIQLGKAIKHAVMNRDTITHPFKQDLSFLYGTIFTGKAENPKHHSRNVCVFAEGEVDRSPTGSGVSARAALHYAKGDIDINQTITIESILNTLMTVKVIDTTTYGQHDSVIPEVSGTASITGQHQFYFDPSDPLKKGFIFR